MFFILMSLMLAMFLAALNQTIVATALPTIGRAFLRLREPVLGGHGVSADLDRGRAALRQAQRHLRPARHDARRHRLFIAGSVALRGGAQHDRADPRPRAAGHRRRRHPAARADRDRRRGRAARARPLPGLYGRGVGDVRRRRPGAGRRARRASALVADLLDQRAARRSALALLSEHHLKHPASTTASTSSTCSAPC